MKMYQNKEQLNEDVDFIKSILEHDPDYRNHIVNTLFNQWMDSSPDSPWYCRRNEGEIEVANTLINIKETDQSNEETHTTVKIDQNGKSSEWNGEHIVFHVVEEESGKRNNQFYNLRDL